MPHRDLLEYFAVYDGGRLLKHCGDGVDTCEQRTRTTIGEPEGAKSDAAVSRIDVVGGVTTPDEDGRSWFEARDSCIGGYAEHLSAVLSAVPKLSMQLRVEPHRTIADPRAVAWRVRVQSVRQAPSAALGQQDRVPVRAPSRRRRAVRTPTARGARPSSLGVHALRSRRALRVRTTRGRRAHRPRIVPNRPSRPPIAHLRARPDAEREDAAVRIEPLFVPPRPCRRLRIPPSPLLADIRWAGWVFAPEAPVAAISFTATGVLKDENAVHVPSTEFCQRAMTEPSAFTDQTTCRLSDRVVAPRRHACTMYDKRPLRRNSEDTRGIA
jgi:hypothetical protein